MGWWRALRWFWCIIRCIIILDSSQGILKVAGTQIDKQLFVKAETKQASAWWNMGASVGCKSQQQLQWRVEKKAAGQLRQGGFLVVHNLAKVKKIAEGWAIISDAKDKRRRSFKNDAFEKWQRVYKAMNILCMMALHYGLCANVGLWCSSLGCMMLLGFIVTFFLPWILEGNCTRTPATACGRRESNNWGARCWKKQNVKKALPLTLHFESWQSNSCCMEATIMQYEHWREEWIQKLQRIWSS